VILPTHALLDGAREKALGGANIGTTSRGIGPAYESKANRTGLRMADLVDPDRFCAIARPLLAHHDAVLKHFYGLAGAPIDETLETYIECGRQLARFVTDTSVFLHGELAKGKKLLCEGAQGVMLDVDHGTYPFVTSSNASIGGVCTGLGVPPSAIHGVLGVAKAYTTRVGEGPLPTELSGELAERLREGGQEYGASTGRPRRCGWYDAVVVRYSARINGLDAIALTKLDVLDGLPEVRVCTGYRTSKGVLTEFPADLRALASAEPVYETLPGWTGATRGATRFSALPPEAQRYIKRLEEVSGVPCAIISTGSDRNETIVRDDTIIQNWFSKQLA
jgi:adenylosuccinate synthase